tara:strand:- start:746 stop:1309 length:564 start_codon:yes stop_codon:yes gene_type:complete
MKKIDFEDFILENKLSHLNGQFNIWLYNNSKTFGYKIFFEHVCGPDIFLHDLSTTLDSLTGEIPPEFKNQDKIFTEDKLNKMYKLLDKLYELNLHPKPIEIFKYKSIMGIKMGKVNSITQQNENKLSELNKNKKALYKLFPKPSNYTSRHSYVPRCIDFDTIEGYGLYNGKYVIIDIDVVDLSLSKI